MTEPVVEVRALRKTYRVSEREEGLGATLRSLFRRRYRDVEAVSGIDFQIAAGESVRIYGEVQPLDISPRARGYQGLWKRVPIGPCSFRSSVQDGPVASIDRHAVSPSLTGARTERRVTTTGPETLV